MCQVESRELSMSRQDVGSNVVEISSSTGVSDRWLVVRRTLDASHISIQVSLHDITPRHVVICEHMPRDRQTHSA